MLYPAAKVILFDPAMPNKLLLLFRDLFGAIGYEAAGGRVEVDFKLATAENFEMCAIREIREEVGVECEITNYLGSYSFFWDSKPDSCSSCVVFLGKITGGSIVNDNVDVTELPYEIKWVETSDILNGLAPVRDSHAALKPMLIKAAKMVETMQIDTFA